MQGGDGKMANPNSNTYQKHVRQMSTDSGAPSSQLEDNPKDETELKQPLNRHIVPNHSEHTGNERHHHSEHTGNERIHQFKNYTRLRGKSGHLSDTSSLTSQLPQTTDTEIETTNVLRHVEKIVGKKPSRKGKSESPYIHIGKIVVNNNPRPDGNPYYYDHPPPPPCDNSYTYMNDYGEKIHVSREEGKSVYYNFGKEPMEQGSTPRGASPSRLEEQELHPVENIHPYKMTTEDFVTGGREENNTIRKVNTFEEDEGAGYGFLVPELNIEASKQKEELEITLRTKGPGNKIWRGTLTPHVHSDVFSQLKLDTPEETLNKTYMESSEQGNNSPVGPQLQSQRVSTASSPLPGPQLQSQRVSTASSPLSNNGHLDRNSFPVHMTQSAPELTQEINMPNKDYQMQFSRQERNSACSGSDDQTVSQPSQLYKDDHGVDPRRTYSQTLLQSSQPSKDKHRHSTQQDQAIGKEWKSHQDVSRAPKHKIEKRPGIFSKPHQTHNPRDCCSGGFYDIRDERIIGKIKERFSIEGKDCMWTITILDNYPSNPYCLNIKYNNKVFSYPVCKDKKGRVSIDKSKKTFSCLRKLIVHYTGNKLPNSDIKLGPHPFVIELTPPTDNGIQADDKVIMRPKSAINVVPPAINREVASPSDNASQFDNTAEFSNTKL